MFADAYIRMKLRAANEVGDTLLEDCVPHD